MKSGQHSWRQIYQTPDQSFESFVDEMLYTGLQNTFLKTNKRRFEIVSSF